MATNSQSTKSTPAPVPSKQTHIPNSQPQRDGGRETLANNNTVSFTRPVPPAPTPPKK